MSYYRDGTRYLLVDVSGGTYQINDDTFRRMEDESTIEVDIIERSFKAGADFPGIQRDESKEISYQYQINTSEQAYRLYENQLRQKLRKVRWIRDTINNIETEILFKESAIAYDDGGFNLGSVNNISFIQLKPYWRDVEPTILQESGVSSQAFIIENNGYVETPTIITIQALEPCPKFQIINTCEDIELDGQGIVVEDIQFGTVGLDTYIIDNGAGAVELNQADRRNKVRLGTGPFNLGVGRNRLDFTLQGQCAITIEWRRRYYL